MIDLPIEFTEKFTGLLGSDEANKLFNALQEPTKKAFRLNPLKSGYKDVKQDLTEKLALIKDAYVGQIDGHSIEQLAGYVYSQDQPPCLLQRLPLFTLENECSISVRHQVVRRPNWRVGCTSKGYLLQMRLTSRGQKHY